MNWMQRLANGTGSHHSDTVAVVKAGRKAKRRTRRRTRRLARIRAYYDHRDTSQDGHGEDPERGTP